MLVNGATYGWTDPTIVDKFCPHKEACSKVSGLTPRGGLWHRDRL